MELSPYPPQDRTSIPKYMENIKIWIFFPPKSTKPPGLELKNLQSPIVPPTPLFSFSLLATCAEYSPLRHQPHPPSTAIFLAKYVTRLAIRFANFLMATG